MPGANGSIFFEAGCFATGAPTNDANANVLLVATRQLYNSLSVETIDRSPAFDEPIGGQLLTLLLLASPTAALAPRLAVTRLPPALLASLPRAFPRLERLSLSFLMPVMPQGYDEDTDNGATPIPQIGWGCIAEMPHLTSVTVDRCYFTDAAGAAALTTLSALREVAIKGCSFLRTAGLVALSNAASAARVSVLDLSRCGACNGGDGVDEASAGAAACAALRKFVSVTELSLASCAARLVTDAAIAAVAESMPRLRMLKIDEASAISDKALSGPMATRMTSLTSLSLRSCGDCFDDAACLTDAGGFVPLFARLPLLVDLDVSMTRIGVAGVATLAATATQLRALQLDYCQNVDDACIAALAPLGGSLEVLALDSVPSVGDAGIAHIGRSMARLRELHLGDCANGGGRSPDFVRQLAGGGAARGLRKLWLSQSPLGDGSIPHLAHFTQLEELQCNNCSAVTDAGLAALAALDLPRLACVDFSNASTHVTDAGIAALARAGGGGGPLSSPALRRIRISNCRGLTDAGLAHFAAVAAASSRGGPSSCPGVAAAAAALRDLDISQCRGVTLDGIVEHVAHGVPTLLRLVVNGCCAVAVADHAARDRIRNPRKGRTIDVVW